MGRGLVMNYNYWACATDRFNQHFDALATVAWFMGSRFHEPTVYMLFFKEDWMVRK